MEFSKQILTQKLYDLGSTASKTLKDKRTWAAAGIAGSVVLGQLIGRHYFLGEDKIIPYIQEICPTINYEILGQKIRLMTKNFPVKLITNYVFPGGLGAALFKKFAENYKGEEIKNKFKYYLSGSLLAAGAWGIFQYLGNHYGWLSGFYGQSPFEPMPELLPMNLSLAVLAATSPYLAGYLENKLLKQDDNKQKSYED